MGVLMTYRSFPVETFEPTFELVSNGEENWNLITDTMGNDIDSIHVDKSWIFLGTLFEKSEIGNFIYGEYGESFFDGEEYAFSLFSTENLTTFCTYIEHEGLTDKETFLALCRANGDFEENSGEYYFTNFLKIYNFYKKALQQGNWVLGEME